MSHHFSITMTAKHEGFDKSCAFLNAAKQLAESHEASISFYAHSEPNLELALATATERVEHTPATVSKPARKSKFKPEVKFADERAVEEAPVSTQPPEPVTEPIKTVDIPTVEAVVEVPQAPAELTEEEVLNNSKRLINALVAQPVGRGDLIHGVLADMKYSRVADIPVEERPQFYDRLTAKLSELTAEQLTIVNERLAQGELIV